MKKAIGVLAAVTVGAVSWLGLTLGAGWTSTSFRTVQIEQGDVESVVSSTGGL